jgi:hypothetical protein
MANPEEEPFGTSPEEEFSLYSSQRGNAQVQITFWIQQ